MTPLQRLSDILGRVIDRCVLTKRQEQIFKEELTKHFCDILQRPEEQLPKMEAVLVSRGKQSLFEKIVREKITEQEKLTKQEAEIFDKEWAAAFKWSRNYEKAYYGKCRQSEEKRKALDFLRNWHNVAIYNRESGRLAKDSERLHLLTPLLSALNSRNAEFFKGLAQAMQILNDRLYNSKNPNIGSGDLHLEKWLLEYALKYGPRAHTARELNEQFVSKFRAISDDKLRRKCKPLGVDLKPDKRGPKITGKFATPIRRKKD